jgi:hypothetical protein
MLGNPRKGAETLRRPVGYIKRAPRIDYSRPAVLVDSAGVEHDVTVLDVSSSGFKLQVSELPKIGDMVTLRVEKSAPVQAQIRWAVADQAGGIFLTPVDSSLLP